MTLSWSKSWKRFNRPNSLVNMGCHGSWSWHGRAHFHRPPPSTTPTHLERHRKSLEKGLCRNSFHLFFLTTTTAGSCIVTGQLRRPHTEASEWISTFWAAMELQAARHCRRTSDRGLGLICGPLSTGQHAVRLSHRVGTANRNLFATHPFYDYRMSCSLKPTRLLMTAQ